MRRRQRAQHASLIGYGLASVVSLGTDLGLFMSLVAIGIAPVSASMSGYGLGIVVHWLISSRFVFAATAAPSGRARTRQKGLFFASALIGLAITTSIVALGALLGLLPIVAKLIAVAVSFQATYMLRKAVVFAR